MNPTHILIAVVTQKLCTTEKFELQIFLARLKYLASLAQVKASVARTFSQYIYEPKPSEDNKMCGTNVQNMLSSQQVSNCILLNSTFDQLTSKA